MSINAGTLAARISSETGLEFSASGGMLTDKTQSYQLRPSHHPPAQTFSLQVQVGWRSIDLSFRPGSFSSELIQAMGIADRSGQAGFISVLQSSLENGAQINFSLNGRERSFDDPSIWDIPWQNMTLTLRKGMLPINDGDAAADEELIGAWVVRLSAAILELLPLEADESSESFNPEVLQGFPEGASVAIQVNRYERDRRNRASALAIHGHICKVCGTDMGHRYGTAATGLIEVHHTTPVSQMGANYIIDPRVDLVPLCPNCHAVAHRRDPPYSVDELQKFLKTEG